MENLKAKNLYDFSKFIIGKKERGTFSIDCNASNILLFLKKTAKKVKMNKVTTISVIASGIGKNVCIRFENCCQ